MANNMRNYSARDIHLNHRQLSCKSSSAESIRCEAEQSLQFTLLTPNGIVFIAFVGNNS